MPSSASGYAPRVRPTDKLTARAESRWPTGADRRPASRRPADTLPESIERDCCEAGVRGRWHRHQDAGDHEEESCKQPAAKTTSHDSHLLHATHRTVAWDSWRSGRRMAQRVRLGRSPGSVSVDGPT